MDLRTHSAICASLLVLAASGCSVRHQTVMVKPVGAAAPEPAGASELIDAGRGFLAEQKFGLAIAQFREALRFDASSAAANNGLGVAYASIGRDDLARRHFERAIAFAPEEASYRRNFDKFAAASSPDRLAAAEQAGRGPSQDVEEAAPMTYHLRQDVNSPADRSNSAGLPVTLPVAANAPTPASGQLVASSTGFSLVTKPVQSAKAAAPSAAVSTELASFTLERRRTVAEPAVPAPELKRLSRYEVKITTRRGSDALAQIMKRDYMAQWEGTPTSLPRANEALTAQDAFRAAIGKARTRIEASRTIALAARACARERLVSYGFTAIARGSAQCSS